jgi:cytochrome b subunit of formate dehydrogenase
MDRRPWLLPGSLGSGARRLLGAASLLLGLAAPGAAQSNDDCLACHSDPELTGSRNGRELSVFVDAEAFAGSVHGGFDCVACHQDLTGADVHDEEVAPVDCGSCHAGEAAQVGTSRHGRLAAGPRGAGAPGCADCHGRHDVRPVAESQIRCAACHGREARLEIPSLHGKAAARGDALAPRCWTCHGGHQILPAADPSSPVAVMNIPLLCGRCHREGSPVSENRDISQDRILENYSMSIHGEGLYRQGLTVTAVCTSCHTAHNILPHTDPASSIHRDHVATTCARCHGRIEQVHRKIIEGRLWQEEPEKIPACVDCHAPHKIRRLLYPAGLANQDCLACHRDPELAGEREGRRISLHVDEAAFAAGAHGGTACAQCHTQVSPSRVRACETVTSKVDCSICHAEQVEQFRGSTHGAFLAQGDPDAPSCLDCHDKHATLPQTLPASPTYPRNVPFLCARCHRAGEQAAVRIEAEVEDIFQSYLDSIHGKGLLESGLVVTATCADCHTAHGELPPSDPRSTVHHANVAATCGVCHHGIEEVFRTSVHWPGNAETDRELPTCEDCHSSHTIGRTDLTDFRFRMMDQCGRCHESEAATFFDTFHGKVSRLGSAGAAKCYDCHGTHNILPPANPESTLARAHVVETCGQCHAGSHRRFAGYLTHATHHDAQKYPWLFWSFWAMTALLVGTLSFALLHTVAWLVRLFLTRGEWRAHKALAKAHHEKLYRRFTRFNRVLHLLMLLSFFTLAATGMALKFSYMSWAQGLAWALGGFAGMALLHRMGALVLVTVFVLHLADVRRRKLAEGKSWRQVATGPDSILFNPRDVKEFVQSIRWFFGLGARPHYGRYTYWEKFDYFAVFWGVLVIGSTGLVLWFPELFTHLLPGWSVNVATIIHSDEALLAVGFIFTIHFFNTHFRPDKFPIDPVIFTGRLTLDELKYDKPAEYEELVRSGRLAEHLVDPFPRPVERAARVFGFIALGIGLLLIALIVYTMLFGYR